MENLQIPSVFEELNEVILTPNSSEEELTRAFFRKFCQRVRAAVGGDEAYLLIGGFLAYAAGPEIFAQHSLFPGVWVHGEANSGKSTVCERLMELWGFSLQSGFMLRGVASTAVGLTQAQGQYSELPLWADEFRNGEVADDKLGVLQNGFNRATQPKFNAAGFQRKVRTNFIVSGESTSSDAALRARFLHIQMSSKRRLGTLAEQRENFQWLLNHRKCFHVLGRHVLEHRREFVKLTQGYMESWSREDIDPRLRLVHGVGYAAWMAMVTLLQSHSLQEIEAFKTYMVSHSKLAAADVVSDLNVNVFVEELITAYKMGAIDWRCFQVRKEYRAFAPSGEPGGNKPGQPDWHSYKLLLDPEPTIAALNIWLPRQRSMLPLKRKDLRDQLSKNDFWLEPKPGAKQLTVRFGTGRSLAWGIHADKHPLGYRRCRMRSMMPTFTTPRKVIRARGRSTHSSKRCMPSRKNPRPDGLTGASRARPLSRGHRPAHDLHRPGPARVEDQRRDRPELECAWRTPQPACG